jgi:predicted dehydrogenase
MAFSASGAASARRVERPLKGNQRTWRADAAPLANSICYNSLIQPAECQMSRSQDNHTTGRRAFLATAAGVGAMALSGDGVAGVLGANERINVGVLGLGSRGGTLIGWLHKIAAQSNVRITAVADLWERRRIAAAQRVAGETGLQPAQCRTAAEMFDRKDVDAVLIATPDFQHPWQSALAAMAGKDIYCEKPFGCHHDEVRQAFEIIRASGRVFCLRVQARGMDKYFAAAEFVQSGKLGQVQYVEISEPIFQQRWRIDGSEDSPKEADVDWREFLGSLPAEKHPFDARAFREFRLFWPFSSGPFCQWMSHRIDLVNLVLGKTPASAAALGGVYLWKDGRTNPDVVQCLLEYPGGPLCSYHLRMGNSAGGKGITLYGTAGTLDLEAGLAYGDGGGGIVTPSETKSGSPQFVVDRSKVLKSRREGGVKIGDKGGVDYLAHFFDAVRHRTAVRGDIHAAKAQADACILANIAYRGTGKAVLNQDGKVASG